ncbi:hypothetical protein K443DRAFT_113758, partial [Laccaria amethystina LaAM-08-1]
NLTIDEVMAFARLAFHLKRDIIQPQLVNEACGLDIPPEILPVSISIFLSNAIEIPLDSVQDCWEILSDYAWSLSEAPLFKADYVTFKQFGWELGLTAVTIYPSSDVCTNMDCPCIVPLKKDMQQQAVVYTHNLGVQPAWYIHIYCPTCKTSYHNNYSVCDGIPTYLQVGEHQFVDHKVVKMWRNQMLLGWFSASNAAHLYTITLSEDEYLVSCGLSDRPTTDHVWDAFVILSLLEDHVSQGTLLTVPHTGNQCDWFKVAMEDRTSWIIMQGQPNAVQHVCDKCMRIFEGRDGQFHECQLTACVCTLILAL